MKRFKKIHMKILCNLRLIKLSWIIFKQTKFWTFLQKLFCVSRELFKLEIVNRQQRLCTSFKCQFWDFFFVSFFYSFETERSERNFCSSGGKNRQSVRWSDHKKYAFSHSCMGFLTFIIYMCRGKR